MYALSHDAGSLYFAGSFSGVGPFTGGGTPLDATTAAVLQPFPRLNGSVSTVVPDGAGGWFVGGSFTRAGDTDRTNLVRVLPDGSVSRWNPNPDGSVASLLLSGRTLYVGGSFTTIGGLSRNRLAAIDVATGAADATWNPNANGSVSTLLRSGSLLYVGGSFTSVGGQLRNRVAALNVSGTGSATAFNPNADGTVLALALSGSTLYVGGQFFNIGGGARNFLAALNTTSGLATAFNPAPTSSVLALQLTALRLYVGGVFTSIAGQPRSYLAAFSVPAGTLDLTFDPNCGGPVDALSLAGGTLYAGGTFSTVAGQPRKRLAAVDATGGTLSSWDPSANDACYALASQGSRVFAGGRFSSVGMVARGNIAALDEATGAVAAWNPGANNAVHALASGAGLIYVGGVFTSIAGLPRSNLAALDAATGVATAWTPSADGIVYAIAYTGSTVIAGGGFLNVGAPALPRARIASLDLATGANTWPFGANDYVYGLALDGGTLYAGGRFTQIGGQVRNRAAALDVSTGLATAWHPDVSGGASPYVRALTASPTAVYLHGDFTTVGAQSRPYMAVVDKTAGTPNSWSPAPTTWGWGLLAAAGKVFAGGNFFSIGGVPRPRLAALDEASQSATAWRPEPDSAARAFLVSGNRLYVGGFFTQVSQEPRHGLVAYCLLAPPSGLVATPAGNNTIALSWSGASAGNRVYRARASAGPYEALGTTNGTSWEDSGAEGGVTYYYTVRGFDGCESDASNTATAVAPGVCQQAPDHEGIAWVQQSATALCGVDAGWDVGAAVCGGPVSYGVYRDTDPAFVPSAANRIAQGLAGTSYADRAELSAGVTYYYVVRALDASNREEDANLTRLSITPSSCTATGPSNAVVLSARAGDGSVDLQWLNPLVPYISTRILFRTDTYPIGPADPLATSLGDFAGGPGQRDGVSHTGLTNGTTYYYAAFVNGSVLFSGATRAKAVPETSASGFKWAYSTNAVALTTPGLIPNTEYAIVSNDRVLHALTPGGSGGAWPPGPPAWLPSLTNAPVQGRPVAVRLPVTSVMGADTLVLLASQDGRLSAVDGRSGAMLWSTQVGTSLQAPPAAMFVDFGGAWDLVFAATRDSLAANRVAALRLADGSQAWSFDNGAGAEGLGVISGPMRVDYATRRLYFASRRRGSGSSDTLWCLDFTEAAAVKRWSLDVGDVDGGPTLRNGVIYVGNNAGTVHAVDAGTGSLRWSWPTGDGAVKGFVWPAPGSLLFFSTSGKVHAISDEGGSASPYWTGGMANGGALAVPNPSTPLVLANVVIVGGANSKLYQLDRATGSPGAPAEKLLGLPSAQAVGSPAYDTSQGLAIVGSESGTLYVVSVPF